MGKSKLQLVAYAKFENGSLSEKIDSYELQLNPNQIYSTFTKTEASSEGFFSALGSLFNRKRPAYYRETMTLTFTLDHSGALPDPADGLSAPSDSSTSGLKPTLEKLKKVAIYPQRSTHAPPFVQLIWGELDIKGTVTDLSFKYTWFDSSGNPLRAVVTLGITEAVDPTVESSKYQSPDITRMPVIRDGQNMVSLCQEYYDDPRYYLQVARVNNLPSFRRLEPGSRLVFPPLEK